ncbi:MAG: PEP-CTERM sorting domain-containing protein [Alphaproteobacteria bacterium]|nr:PEP-CTERM sorting domain-containing protein [Alphaproteobacteria bacterium]
MKDRFDGQRALFAAGVALGLGLAAAHPASAEPIGIFGPFIQLSNVSVNTIGSTTGQRIRIGVGDVIPNGNAGTTGIATTTNLTTGAPVTLTLPFTPITTGPNFYLRTFADNPDLRGPWTLTFTNGPDTNSATVSLPPGATQTPFVQNVTIAGSALTPTFSWKAPEGVTANAYRINIFDKDQLTQTGSPDNILTFVQTGTSFTVLTGLNPTHHYDLEINLLQTRDGTSNGANTNVYARSHAHFEFQPIDTGGPAVNLPTVSPDGVFHFNLTVVEGQMVFIDPLVAIGYDYAIGIGDPNFGSVLLPLGIGDGLYDIFGFNGDDLMLLADDIAGGTEFDFGPGGVSRFRVLGIEPSAGLDPANATAFITGLTFVADGTFTGTQTPLTAELVASVPEPATLLLLGFALIGLCAIGQRHARANADTRPGARTMNQPHIGRHRDSRPQGRTIARASVLRTMPCAAVLLLAVTNTVRADVILTGDIVSFMPGTDLRVGQTGSGQMTVNNGSVVNLVVGSGPTPEAFFVVGRLSGSSGQVSIDGAGSAINLFSAGAPNDSASAQVGREGVGTMSITNGGALNVKLDPNATPAANTLSPSVTVGRDATGSGSLTVNNGSVLVEGTGAFFFVGRNGGSGTADFSNGSTLQIRNTTGHVDGAGLTVGRDSNAVGIANFTNTQVTVDGGTSSGGIFAGRETGANGSISFSGPGTTVNVTAGADAFLTIGRDATTQGLVIVSSGAQMNLTGQRGSIDLGRMAGATGELRISGGSVVDLSGSTLDADAIVGGSFAGKTSAGSGTLLIDGAGSHLDLGNASGGSLHRVIVGAATTLGGVSSDGGHVTVRNGGVLTADVVNVGINGVLDGNGQINAKVSLEGGTIAPGNSPGTMTVSGDLTVDSGVIEVEVGGLGASEYDVLNVLGGVTFTGGSILFKFIDGFLPQLGDTLDFLVADTILGLENVLFGYEGAAQGFLFDISSVGGGLLRFVAENNANPVPEPATLTLLGFVLLGLGMGGCWRVHGHRQ